MHASIQSPKSHNEGRVHAQSHGELNVPHVSLEVIATKPLLDEHENHRDEIHDQAFHSRRFGGDHFAHLLGTLVVLLNVYPSYNLEVGEKLLHRS